MSKKTPSAFGDRGGLAANDPPDPSNFVEKNGLQSDRGHVSFKEKLMGGPDGGFDRDPEDLFESKKAWIEFHKGNRCLPEIHFTDQLLAELCDPWHNSLVIKVLSWTVGYQVLRRKLEQMWQVKGSMEVIDLDHDFFLVRFTVDSDLEYVLSEGPWLIFDHYLLMQKWSPDFIPAAHSITSTLAWVRIPELNILYYRADALKVIAVAIGVPVKMDKNTFVASRGRFARLCVEVDLTKPLVPQILIRGRWHKVKYEGLHKLCFACGQYGHTEEQCGVNQARKSMAVDSKTEAQGSLSLVIGWWLQGKRGPEAN